MGSKENARIKLVNANQMSLIRDTEEVTKFLEFAARKLILNEHAVNCRMTACNNLFSVVQEEEDNVEYMLNNLDVLIHRFSNRNTGVLASTLKVYKSRVKSSLEDYLEWSADPFAWERSITEKAKQTAQERRSEKKPRRQKTVVTVESASQRAVESVATPMPVTVSQEGRRSVSFPVRAGVPIQIQLPESGITVKELQKLILFLYPYCTDMDFDSIRWNPFAPSLPTEGKQAVN